MTRSLLLLALLLAAVAQLLKSAQTLLWLAFLLNAAAIAALAPGRRDDSRPEDESPPTRPTRSCAFSWTALAGAVFGGGSAVACSVSLYRDWPHNLFPVFVLGPLSLLLFAAGLDLLFGFDIHWPWRREQVRRAWRRPEVQLLTVILLIGVFFRFAGIGDFPPPDGFSSIEEAQRATGARWILERGARPWEWPFCQYLAAAAFALCGRNIYALRVPVMILGCATLLPFYALLRQVVSPTGALLATALLAVSRWHVQVSWYNEDVYVPLFFFVLVLYLLARVRRDPRPLWYVIIGACCGYSLYAYAGYRGTTAVVLLFVLSEAIRARHLPLDWRQLGVLAGIIALFALPLAALLQMEGTFYLEALHRSLANQQYYTRDVASFVAQRAARIRATAHAFTVSDHGTFLPALNTGAEPLLDPFTSVLFILGLGTALLQIRRPLRAFLLVAFFLLTGGAAIVVQNLDFRRLSILIPFVFAFTGLAAGKLDASATSCGVQRSFRAVLILLFLGAGAHNYHFLFHQLARDPVVRAYHRDDYTPPAFYLHEHYGGQYVVLLTAVVTNFFQPNDYDWLKPAALKGHVATHAEAIFPFVPPPPKGSDILLLMQRPFPLAALMVRVQAAYPGAACHLRRDRDDSKWDLAVCTIPATAV